MSKNVAVKVYVYFTNGNVAIYEVENQWKAREHAEKIWSTGIRWKVGNRLEWFGPHYIDKICWDLEDERDYLEEKYK